MGVNSTGLDTSLGWDEGIWGDPFCIFVKKTQLRPGDIFEIQSKLLWSSDEGSAKLAPGDLVMFVGFAAFDPEPLLRSGCLALPALMFLSYTSILYCVADLEFIKNNDNAGQYEHLSNLLTKVKRSRF